VSRGHSEEDVVKRYSLNKISLYQQAGRKNQARELKRLACAQRAAFGATVSEFKDYLDALDKG
jgi:hypothetical protein